MTKDLQGKKIAILVDQGFEQVELVEPRHALDEAGARTLLISPQMRTVRAWDMDDWGDEFDVDLELDRVNGAEFDALLLPGGVMNPDRLRMNEQAVTFVRSFFNECKPVAAICHGPWTLIDADAVRGRRMTSWPSLKTDLRNAGADWVNEQVVADRGLVTSRKPDDIPAFNREMIAVFYAGVIEAAPVVTAMAP